MRPRRGVGSRLCSKASPTSPSADRGSLADGHLGVHALIAHRANGDDHGTHIDAICARGDALDLEGERRDVVRCDDVLTLDRRLPRLWPVDRHLRIEVRVAADERETRLGPGTAGPCDLADVSEL